MDLILPMRKKCALWDRGPSGFGYDDGDDATVLDDMRFQYTTVFIRRRLMLRDPRDYESFSLEVTVDDGFVCFVNGKEVARVRVDVPVERLDHTIRATEAIPDADHWRFDLDRAVFRAGENTIALVGVNRLPTSTDLSLIPVLTAQPSSSVKPRERFASFLELPKDPEQEKLLTYLDGRLKQRESRLEEAIRIFEGLVRRERESALPVRRLVECLRETGASRRALGVLVRSFESGVTDDPRCWELWFALAFQDVKLTPCAPSPSSRRTSSCARAIRENPSCG